MKDDHWWLVSTVNVTINTGIEKIHYPKLILNLSAYCMNFITIIHICDPDSFKVIQFNRSGL